MFRLLFRLFVFRFLYVVLTLSIFLFNACYKNPQTEQILQNITDDINNAANSKSTTDDLVDNNEETVPPRAPDNPKEFNYFPYDLQLDTIAYLSCETTNTENHFTLKAGAYFSKSGLRLSEYFLNKKETLNQKKLSSLIKTSTKYKATPFLSIADKSNFNSEYIFTSFKSLSRLQNTIKLITTPNNVRITEYENDPITASLKYSYSNHIPFARKLNKDARLILSYRDSKSAIYHTTGGQQGLDIYGRSYKLQFIEKPKYNRYILNTVSELKLPTKHNTQKTDWSCPDSLKFQIRRHPKNAYTAKKLYNKQTPAYKKQYTLKEVLKSTDDTINISPDEITCPTNTSDKKTVAFKVVKKVLGDGWNINIKQKCISLESSNQTCYTITTKKTSPNNRLSLESDTCSNTKGSKYCPQYLSICVRAN